MEVAFGPLICNRCKETFGLGKECKECGVRHDRIVRKSKRRRPIGGKRGRNSGTVSSHSKH